MPAKNTPQVMAETIGERLHQVPWPLTVFLRKSRAESWSLHTLRANDPECDRLRATVGYYEAGTYSMKGARHAEIVGDLVETMGRAR